MALIRVGHRGAPTAFPANTMQSFAHAAALGCEMVETDIRAAVDGVLVLAHDPHVVDMAGKHYLIAETASTVLAALDLGAGEGVPTLEELVRWARGRCAIMADMKCEGDGVEERTARALRELPQDGKIVPGAGPEGRQRLREADPALPLSRTVNRPEGEALFGPRRLLGTGSNGFWKRSIPRQSRLKSRW